MCGHKLTGCSVFVTHRPNSVLGQLIFTLCVTHKHLVGLHWTGDQHIAYDALYTAHSKHKRRHSMRDSNLRSLQSTIRSSSLQTASPTVSANPALRLWCSLNIFSRVTLHHDCSKLSAGGCSCTYTVTVPIRNYKRLKDKRLIKQLWFIFKRTGSLRRTWHLGAFLHSLL